MSSQADKGAALLEAGKFDEAIEQYNLAIGANNASPQYYINRSTAYQRKSPADLETALRDADYAVIAAVKRARRELIAQAQLRRAVILFNLERYGDAALLFDVVKELNPKEKTIGIWEAKIGIKTRDLAEDDAKRKVRVEKTPSGDLPQASEQPPEAAEKNEARPTKSAGKAAASAPSMPQIPQDGKFKSDWYQSGDKVFFNLLVKGLPKDQVAVEIQQESVNISFPTGNGSSFSYSLDPLYAPIDPSDSTYKITPTKIELSLKKSMPQKWHSIEATPASSTTTPSSTTNQDTSTPTQNPMVPTSQQQPTTASKAGPVYPTSSKTGPKNWDKLAHDIDDGKDGEGDDVNRFFQQLYKGADADTQRAMMKSFQESNGTVLSTNWKEVKAATVETQPPDGMEAKTWDQ